MKAGIFSYIISCLRIAIGIIFFISGAIKLINPAEFFISLQNFNILPEVIIVPFGLLISSLELIAGLFMMVGLWLTLSSFIVAILLIVFLAAIIPLVISGTVVDCGCFGSIVEEKADIYLIVRDVIFLIMTLIVYQDVNQKFSLDTILRRRRSIYER